MDVLIEASALEYYRSRQQRFVCGPKLKGKREEEWQIGDLEIPLAAHAN